MLYGVTYGHIECYTRIAILCNSCVTLVKFYALWIADYLVVKLPLGWHNNTEQYLSCWHRYILCNRPTNAMSTGCIDIKYTVTAHNYGPFISYW